MATQATAQPLYVHTFWSEPRLQLSFGAILFQAIPIRGKDVILQYANRELTTNFHNQLSPVSSVSLTYSGWERDMTPSSPGEEMSTDAMKPSISEFRYTTQPASVNLAHTAGVGSHTVYGVHFYDAHSQGRGDKALCSPRC